MSRVIKKFSKIGGDEQKEMFESLLVQSDYKEHLKNNETILKRFSYGVLLPWDPFKIVLALIVPVVVSVSLLVVNWLKVGEVLTLYATESVWPFLSVMLGLV